MKPLGSLSLRSTSQPSSSTNLRNASLFLNKWIAIRKLKTPWKWNSSRNKKSCKCVSADRTQSTRSSCRSCGAKWRFKIASRHSQSGSLPSNLSNSLNWITRESKRWKLRSSISNTSTRSQSLPVLNLTEMRRWQVWMRARLVKTQIGSIIHHCMVGQTLHNLPIGQRYTALSVTRERSLMWQLGLLRSAIEMEVACKSKGFHLDKGTSLKCSPYP